MEEQTTVGLWSFLGNSIIYSERMSLFDFCGLIIPFLFTISLLMWKVKRTVEMANNINVHYNLEE